MSTRSRARPTAPAAVDVEASPADAPDTLAAASPDLAPPSPERDVPAPADELVRGEPLRPLDSNSAMLSALCAAQSQHPSDLAARAIRVLVERISTRVLAS